MNKRNTSIAVVLLFVGGVVWALGLFAGEDPQVAEAKAMQQQLFQNIDNMTDDERRANFEAMREKTRGLSDEQRREVWQGSRQFMMQRVDSILALPRAEQNKELDKWIDRMEDRRNQRNASDSERGPRGGDMTDAERAQRGKSRLDRSSPDMRAKMDAMGDLLNARREARGLKPIDGPPFGRDPR